MLPIVYLSFSVYEMHKIILPDVKDKLLHPFTEPWGVLILFARMLHCTEFSTSGLSEDLLSENE